MGKPGVLLRPFQPLDLKFVTQTLRGHLCRRIHLEALCTIGLLEPQERESRVCGLGYAGTRKI